MFDESFAFPPALVNRVGGSSGRVAVIGAGVAGLVCAYELQRCGFQVVLYERSRQPGGRVRTHRFWDGTHADLGAMRIPGNHHCVLHYVSRFGLRTRPFVNANPSAYYHLRGHRVRARDVHALFPEFALRDAEKQAPTRLLDRLLGAVWETLTTGQKRRVLEGHWDDPALDRLISVSLWQFVHENLSQDAWDLVGHASGLAHYEQSSLLEVLVDYFGLFHAGQLELVDGMDSLTRAFVRALRPRTLQLSTNISELVLTGEGVLVRGRRMDHPTTEQVDFVVCCVPAPALDQITFLPGLPHPQRHAVRGISYASSSKSLLHLTRRRWESQDGIFGGGSFTDLPIQQCWYPSDNARPVRDGADGSATLRWVAQDPRRSEEPSVLLGAYLWGANARRAAALPPADRDRLVLACLEQLHPGIGDDVDDIVHWNWDEQVGMGGGAFAHLPPGEHTRYLTVLGSPHPVGDPRIFFAGEHLSGAHAWCQGAAQSALGAVGLLLDRSRHAEVAARVGAA
ncbi:FAD-dependent oxidoreductase [Kitasatospora sp. NBC_01250]|uniref:flavin monoamine oxidase family protein n=1 Tax=unclassified Kitasatospora TaxID=2633591 RepID=UPI002E13A868|nr:MULTISPECIES: NAD(P)/FAD-dependent oxidoreductase [unclassified Kitasatospora]WSJ64647.1 FAD-dependent oxidoreductase [Kitasatospora sp. NBC_01302]